MIRYSELRIREQRNLREEFHFHTNQCIAMPFQRDYCDFLLSTCELKERQIEEAYKKEHYTKWVPDGAIPYQAYGLKAEAGDRSLSVYMMLRANSILGDIAILQMDQAPHSHLVLYGEHAKRWLNEGIADFSVPGQNVKEEIEDLLGIWQEFRKRYAVETRDQRHETIMDAAKHLTLHDPIDLVTKYCYPIDHTVWQGPEFYNYTFSEKLPAHTTSANPEAAPTA